MDPDSIDSVAMLNPFEAPRASLDTGAELVLPTEAAAVRRAHLSHEERVLRSGSWLVFVGTSVALFTTVAAASSMDTWLAGAPPEVALAVLKLVGCFLVGAAYVALGARLLQLRGDQRVVTAVACVPLLFVLPPLTTWLGARMMHALLSKKGARVLAGDYLEVRRATPELQVPRFTWVMPFCGAFVAVSALWFALWPV